MLSFGLIHYWTLNESSGNSRVDSIGSLTLLETNGTVASASGKNGNAASFNTNNNHFLTGNALLNTTPPISIACWFNFNTYPVAGTDWILALSNGETEGQQTFLLAIDAGIPTGVVGMVGNASDEGTDGVLRIEGISLSTWHLAIIKITSTHASMSLDGGTFVTRAIQGTIYENSSTFYIGFPFPLTPDGLIDAYGIWNVALTQQQATDLWNGGAGLFP